MGRKEQQTLAMEGAQGPDPELDRLARELLDAMDVEEAAAAKTAGLEDQLKSKMEDTGDSQITVDGVTFKLKFLKQLTKKGRHSRGEGREE